ncbi:MAG TPA: hypothetical protein VJU16_04515 [Planctomycetota bacterium]|nr:hypothetical protein [Planctomycetota bacterium]
MMQKLRIVLGTIAAVLLVSFIAQNFGSISIKFWPFGRVDAPVWIVVAGSAGMGILAFYFFQAFRKSKPKT